LGELCSPKSPKSAGKWAVRALNYKLNWKEPSLTCRPRLTDVRATFYL